MSDENEKVFKWWWGVHTKKEQLKMVDEMTTIPDDVKAMAYEVLNTTGTLVWVVEQQLMKDNKERLDIMKECIAGIEKGYAEMYRRH